MILEVNDDNFENSIKEGICLVDFWAPWCGPCRMLSPVIDELAEETKDIKVFKCNVDEAKETPSKFGIMGVPTLIIFKNGKIINVYNEKIPNLYSVKIFLMTNGVEIND